MSRLFVITEKDFPDIPAMMLATLKALKEIGGSASIQELDEKVVEIEQIPEQEQSILMANDTGRPRLNYYLSWARTFLRRGGAVENSARGVWSLTELGSAISGIEPLQAIYQKVQEEEKERAKEKRRLKAQQKKKREAAKALKQLEFEVSEEETAEDDPDNWKHTLLETLKSMDPSAFERLSQRLLREAGFVKVEVRGKSGDGGIDGVGILRVNLVSFQVFFQCKRYKDSVGSSAIRDFRGAMQGRADKGIFITTGTYTAQANDEATRDGAVAIDLIDGERLCDLLKQYELGVKTEVVERVTVEKSLFENI